MTDFLPGEGGRTSFRSLGTLSRTALEQRSKHTYHITDRSVGKFLCAKLHKRKENDSDCFIDQVIIATLYDDVIYTLPCYQWLCDESNIVTLRHGDAVLAASESHEYLTLQRELQVQDRMLAYRWHKQGPAEEYDGFPGYVDVGSFNNIAGLPKGSRFSAANNTEEHWNNELQWANKCKLELWISYAERLACNAKYFLISGNF